MTKRGFLSAIMISAALFLSSCGGGSGGGQSSVVIPPTPTPTPTPNPVAYPSGYDFAYDILAQTPYVEMNYVRVSTSNDPLQDTAELASTKAVETPQAALSWNVGTKSAQVSVNGTVSNFPASASQTDNPKRKYFILNANGTNETSLMWGGDLFAAGYDRVIPELAAAWTKDVRCPPSSSFPLRCDITMRRFLAGPQTLSSERPSTGSSRYNFYISLTPAADAKKYAYEEDGSWLVDHAAGTLKEVDMEIGGILLNSIYFTGTIDRTQTIPIRGTFSHRTNGVTGTFIGNFFGAEGKRIGLLLRGQAPDGTPVVGHVVADYWRPGP